MIILPTLDTELPTKSGHARIRNEGSQYLANRFFCAIRVQIELGSEASSALLDNYLSKKVETTAAAVGALKC